MANNEETAALFSPKPTFDVGTEQQFIKDYSRDKLKQSFDKLNSKNGSTVSSDTTNNTQSVAGKSRPIISNTESKFGSIFDSINNARESTKQKFNQNKTINTLTESPFVKTVSEGINTAKQTVKTVPSMFKSNYEKLTETLPIEKTQQIFKPQINNRSTQQTQYSNRLPTKKEIGIFSNELKTKINANVISPVKQKTSVKFNQIKSTLSPKQNNKQTAANTVGKTFKGNIAKGISKIESAWDRVGPVASFANDLGRAAFSPNLMSAYNILSGKKLPQTGASGSHIKDVDDSSTGLSSGSSMEQNISGGNIGTILGGGSIGGEDSQPTTVSGSDKNAVSVLNKIYQILSMTHNKINKIGEDTAFIAKNAKINQAQDSSDYANRLARLNEIGENYRASQTANAPHHEHHEHEEDKEEPTSYDIDLSRKNKTNSKQQKRTNSTKGRKGVRNKVSKPTKSGKSKVSIPKSTLEQVTKNAGKLSVAEKSSGILSDLGKFAKGTTEVVGDVYAKSKPLVGKEIEGLGSKSASALGKLGSAAGVVTGGINAYNNVKGGNYGEAALDAGGAALSYVNPASGLIMAGGSVVGEGIDWANKKAHSAIFGDKPEKNSLEEHQREYQKYKKLEEDAQKELTDFTSTNVLQNTEKKDVWGDPIKGYKDSEKQKQYEDLQEKLKSANHKKDVVKQHAKKTFDEINPQDETIEKDSKAIEALKKRGYSDETLQSLGPTDKNYLEIDGKRYPPQVNELYEKVIEQELSGKEKISNKTEKSTQQPLNILSPEKEHVGGSVVRLPKPQSKLYFGEGGFTETSNIQETEVQEIPSATPIGGTQNIGEQKITATPAITPMLEGAVHADMESQDPNVTSMLEGAVHADESAEYDTTKVESANYDTVSIEKLDIKELKIDTLYSPQPTGIFEGQTGAAGTSEEGGGFFGKVKKALGFGGEETEGSVSGVPSATKAGKGEGKEFAMPADKVFGIAGKFESGNDAGKISSGVGDAGGKSYGQFQLSSKTGDVNKFLKGSGYEEQFKGLEIGSKEFDAKWQNLAKNDEKFSQAQKEHAKKTHFDPQMKKLQEAGVHLESRGDTVKAAVFSTANQYGANTSTITKALSGKDTSKMSDEEIVNTIQDYKQANVKSNFKSSNENVQAGVSKRIEQERKLLNQQLAEEKKAKELTPEQKTTIELAKSEQQAVSMSPEQKQTASLVQEQKSQEPLLSAALKAPPAVGEKPEPKPIQTSLAQQQVSAPAPQTGQKSAETGFGNKLMKVRNDDPLILTLQYGNVRTV
jgi:hypothetical protein